VSPSPSPVVANWELVIRLRERREQLGITVNDITNELNFTRNWWSAIENERRLIPENTLTAVFDILKFAEQERRKLLELREDATENGWWNDYSALFNSELRRLFGLEQGAQGVREFETLLIPGLLQTKDYARAIMRSEPTIRKVEVEQRVEARLRRQERLRGSNPLDVSVILSEATLRQQIGGAEVLRGQLDHLLDLIEQQNIEIRIIPFTATACALFGSGTLYLLDFQSPRLPMVAWQETVTTRSIITDATQVRDITMAFNEALERAEESRETKKIIDKHRKDLR
jgi:transcriptional regulator with XRE-family HTH domain